MMIFKLGWRTHTPCDSGENVLVELVGIEPVAFGSVLKHLNHLATKSFPHPSVSMHVHINNFFYTCFSPGAGDGSSAVIYGELARTYTKKERTAIISFFITLTHIGFIIGMPATTTQYTLTHYLPLDKNDFKYF